jgi:glucosamine kinase
MIGEPLVTLPAALRTSAPGVCARWVLGVDGGATKTLAAVYDTEQYTLHLGHGGPSNPDAVGAQSATASLLAATDEAISRAETSVGEIDAAVLAIAGTDTEAVSSLVAAARPQSWVVVNDVVGAWAAATGARPGVATISGTGSNVFGVGEDGRSWRAGGWGHSLGDEGSGYWIAVQALKAALADRDRSGPETALGDAALAFFEVAQVEEIPPRVYSKPLTAGEIAAFAVEVARVAHEGDAVACAIYERAATELMRQIAAVIERTGLCDEFPVGLIGSAFKAGELFVAPLAERVARLAPQARVAVVEMAPVGGCVLLAARVGGRDGAVHGERLKTLIDAALVHEAVLRD